MFSHDGRLMLLGVPAVLLAALWIDGAIAQVQSNTQPGLEPRYSRELADVSVLMDRQDWTGAEGRLRGYLAAHPQSGNAHALLAEVLFQTERPDESIQEFGSVQRKLTAGESKTLGLDYATIGKMEEANKFLVQSVEIDPQDQGAWAALGHVQVELARYEEAIKSFRHLLLLAPKTAFAATEIGLASQRISRFDDAAAAYREAIEWQAPNTPVDPMPYIGLGSVLVIQNKPEQALAPLLKIEPFDANDTRVHEQLGRAYLALNRLDDARAELEESVRLNSTIARNHLVLSQVYRRLGRKEDAEAQMKAFLGLTGSQSSQPAQPASTPDN